MSTMTITAPASPGATRTEPYAPERPSWTQTLERAALRARMTLATIVAWLRARVETIRSDDRGLEVAEYVLLGALVIVAASAIGGAIVIWLQNHANTITNTP